MFDLVQIKIVLYNIISYYIIFKNISNFYHLNLFKQQGEKKTTHLMTVEL